MVKKRWVLKKQDNQLIELLSSELAVHPLVVNVMLNRGLRSTDEMKRFITPDIYGFHDPFLLAGMGKAVERLKAAIAGREKIAIYGDYDVDGITSVSVLYLALKELGAEVIYYIPDRIREGYGLNCDAVKILKNRGVSLIVTVDCGITANREVEFARELGVDVIVTDHHKCPDTLPRAVAVVDPNQPGCRYPFRELAGVGVAFKLVQALNAQENVSNMMAKYGSLIALGTVADIVPLKDENRIIVHHGIKRMRKDQNHGIQALLQVSGLSGKEINSGALGFQLAPRINAAGRIGDAGAGVELFVSENSRRVEQIAVLLEQQNTQRKELEQDILHQAKELIRQTPSILNQNILILKGAGWHHGVIGIVASRLTEEYYKPCILFAEENGVLKGSARSVKGFDIYNALSAVGAHIERFGGHELAAGLTLQEGQYDVFKRKLEAYCRDHITEEMLVQQVSLDGEIHDRDMTEKLVSQLQMLEPFGMGNAQPNFLVRKAKVVKNIAFKEGKHLKLSLRQRDKLIDAVGFSMGRYSTVLKTGDQVSVAGNLYINEFRGERYFSIRIKDIRLS